LVNVSVALIREIREMIEIFYGNAGKESLGFESDVFDSATSMRSMEIWVEPSFWNICCFMFLKIVSPRFHCNRWVIW
jgi:hypothetical protein